MMGQLLTVGDLARTIRSRNGYNFLEAWHVRKVLKDNVADVVQRAGRCRVIDEQHVPLVEAALRAAGYLPVKKGKT